MGIPAAPGVDAAGQSPALDQASAVVSGTLTAVGPGDCFPFRGPMNWLIFATISNNGFTTTNGSLSATVSSGTGMAAGGAINSKNVPAGTTWATFSGTSGTLALPAYSYRGSNFSTSSAQVTLPPGSNVNQLLGATVTVSSTRESLTLPAGTTVVGIVQADVAAAATSPGTPGIILLSNIPTTVPPNGGPISAPSQHWLRFQLTSNAITTGVDAAAVFTGASVTYSGTVQIERSFDGGKTFVVCNQGGGGTLAQYNAGTPVSMCFGEPEKFGIYRPNCIAYQSGTINYRISQTGGANESLAIGPLIGG